MVAAAVRRGLRRAGAAALLAAGVALAAVAQEDTTFLTGERLAARLMHNLVTVAADDLSEQGFGLVVAVTDGEAYVLTARHVVARRPPAGLEGAERVSAAIDVRFCAAIAQPAARASLVGGFDAAGADIALLRVRAPAGYAPEARALAPPDKAAIGSPTWVLGFEQRCELAAGSGAIESPADAHDNVRARHAGVRGGSSGGPLLVGHGLAALVTDSDHVMVTAHGLAALQRRLQGQGLPWSLDGARNIPPTDPGAAEVDLAETLNRYLFALRETHGLLLQPKVARATFKDYVDNYNHAIARFRDARDKYDGTLAQHWPAGVLPAWRRLRDALWAVHLHFWQVNEHARAVYETQAVPSAVREQMQALEPELLALQRDIAQFLRILAHKE